MWFKIKKKNLGTGEWSGWKTDASKLSAGVKPTAKLLDPKAFLAMLVMAILVCWGHQDYMLAPSGMPQAVRLELGLSYCCIKSLSSTSVLN